jgi:hypothetical protein
VSVKHDTPGRFTPRKEAGIHLKGLWVSLKDGLEILEKKKKKYRVLSGIRTPYRQARSLCLS